MVESRRRTRVNFAARAEVQVGRRRYQNLETRDLSHKGIFVLGPHPEQAGKNCRVTVHLGGEEGVWELHLNGLIKRVTTEGMAIDFISMDPDTYLHLRKIVLLNTDNPRRAEREFATPAFAQDTKGKKG